MCFDSSFFSLMKTGGDLTVKRIGVNDASTFTGFCHKHDSQTFAPIDQPVLELAAEHVFLSAYRAICRELFTKTAVSAEGVLRTARQLDKGKDTASQKLIQEFNKYREAGLDAGLRDLRHAKSEYDKALLDRAYEKISYYAVVFDHALPIVCTVGLTPEIDFHGNQLQTLDYPTQHADLMTCSVLKISGGNTAVVLAWLSERNGACSGLVKSLGALRRHALPAAVIRFIFEHGENVFFTPSWWGGLDDTSRETIAKHANSFTDKPVDTLRAGGPLQILWSVTEIKKAVRV